LTSTLLSCYNTINQ